MRRINVTSLQAGLVMLSLGVLMSLLVYICGGSCFGRSTESVGGRRLVAQVHETKAVQSQCFFADPSPKLKQFVDALPIIPKIKVSTGKRIVMRAYKISQKVHRDLPNTTFYGFGTKRSTARVPGPALEAQRNVTTYIRWENHISDAKHFLTVDTTVTMAIPRRGGVPMVTHLHGMEVESIYDGHPDAWFTSLNETGPTYVTQDYVYPNTLQPALLWYHDHTVGMTRLNVIAGLAGPYIIRGDQEPIGLPDGNREVILVIQDRVFFPNGSMNYPSVGDDTTVHPNWCPSYYGDTVLVNGKAWPYLKVLPFKYRFRIVNGASDRYFRLSLDRANMTFLKIGTDGGYLHTPLVVNDILLGPAERVDCIIDFGGLKHKTKVVLNNTAAAPYPGGPSFPPTPSAKAIMQFRVGRVSRRHLDPSKVPAILGEELPVLTDTNDTIPVRTFTLTETINNAGFGTQVLLANRTWDDPATEFVSLGSTEIWQFIGLTPDVAHPIHIHLIKFQMLSVQVLNSSAYLAQTCSIELSSDQSGSCFLGPSREPDAQEIGWKDVTSAGPDAVTRVVMRFTSQDGTPFVFDATHGPGYLWHCHLLSHEDNSMMRPMYIEN